MFAQVLKKIVYLLQMVEIAGEGCGCDCWLLAIGNSWALQQQKITQRKNNYTKNYKCFFCLGATICIGQEIWCLPYEELF